MQRVHLTPHHPGWAAEFARESAAVTEAMGDSVIGLHHIGSTAIPDIPAKPIIDILAVVTDLSALDERAPRLQDLGYEVMGEFGIPGRRYFRKDDPNGERTHQIHAFHADSPQVARHLTFRDFLIAHPDIAREYADLKLKLAALYPDDIGGYSDGKDDFIRDIDARAARWAGPEGTSNTDSL